MRRHFKRSYITLLCILVLFTQGLCSHALAAATMTDPQWQQLTSDKAFGYRNDRELKEVPAQRQPGAFEKAIYLFFKFWESPLGTVLLWILVISLVAYIVFRVFFRNDSFLFGKNKKPMGTGSVQDNDERDLATTNWEALLHAAVQNGDYRLAVRYTYMWMLQLMQQRSLIQYRIDKTNYDYYAELNDTAYKQPFRQLSRQYEYTWYGRFPLSHGAYNEYRDMFEDVKKQLGS